MQNNAPYRRRWQRTIPRLTVRSQMVLILAIGLGLGGSGRSASRQRVTVAAIKKAGGSVDYDSGGGTKIPSIMNSLGWPQATNWLVNHLGIDYVANIAEVNFAWHRMSGNKLSADEALAYVAQLSQLESLQLNGTSATDAGMAHIRGLTGLRHLDIRDTLITDGGLIHLKDMTKLKTLFLAGSNVTDEGVLELQNALPRVQIVREEDFAVQLKGGAAIKSLEFARSQPIREACKLLDRRAMVMASRDKDELTRTVNALCELEAGDRLSLEQLALTCSQCLGILDPSISPSLSITERRNLQRRCADRGVMALRIAVEQGYNNIRRLEGDYENVSMFANFRDHPTFPRLIEAVRGKRPGR